MKKIISSIIIVVLLMGLCTTNTFAAQDALTKKDAILLLEDAYRMMILGQCGYYPYDLDAFEDRDYTDGNEGFEQNYEVAIKRTESASGEKYPRSEIYWIIKQPLSPFYEEFATIEKIKSAAKKCFTEKISQRVLMTRRIKPDGSENFSHLVDTYFENENSELFMFASICPYDFWNMFLYSYGAFKCTGDTAKLFVTVWKNEPPLFPDIYSEETVEFTKTADGWRVSGGTAFEVMLEDREPNRNPSTGDASSYTVPALTVAAIISVALPVTLLRKRRRVV